MRNRNDSPIFKLGPNQLAYKLFSGTVEASIVLDLGNFHKVFGGLNAHLLVASSKSKT